MSILGVKRKKEEASKPVAEPVVVSGRKEISGGTNPLLIKRPLVTEKTTALSRLNKYAFVVDKKASSREIKKNIESLYKVNVVSVNVINVRPKKKRLGRSVGKIPGYKKAVLTLKSGQTIDILPH
ncbi:MAG: 50S ribosomal protein L23 [Parcubacteria group bacterium]|nr:50S ribosomal protein L23 [Parcubacteria group bacterium]